MNVVCAWCRGEGRSALIRIIEPSADISESHGICERHSVEFLAAAEDWIVAGGAAGRYPEKGR